MSVFAALAAHIEEGFSSRDLDADIYEAFGYRVKRAPEGRNGISWRYFDLNYRRWISMEHMTSSIDECSRFIERRFPGWQWSVGNTGPNEEPHACITVPEANYADVEGSAPYAALALAAALCRAQAVRTGS